MLKSGLKPMNNTGDMRPRHDTTAPQTSTLHQIVTICLSSVLMISSMVDGQLPGFRFKSEHQNTDAGTETEIPGPTYNPGYYHDGPASCFISPLWEQQSTPDIAILLYSPTARSTGR